MFSNKIVVLCQLHSEWLKLLKDTLVTFPSVFVLCNSVITNSLRSPRFVIYSSNSVCITLKVNELKQPFGGKIVKFVFAMAMISS